jgi:phosphotransferase system HPr-like phosphotransfer protein
MSMGLQENDLVKVEAKGDGADAIELEIQKIINDIQE